MKKVSLFLFLFSGIIVQAQSILSPSKNISLEFKLSNEGKPTYKVVYKTKEVIKESTLGITLKDNQALENGFSVLKQETKATNRKINIIFKVYDEGVAFRYEFPKQESLNYFIISEEKTEFNLVENHKAFWIPGDYDSQEYAYNETKISEIDNSKLDLNNGIGVKSIASQSRVQSPLMMKSPNGIYINIFEAAVVNYPIMHLDVDTKNYSLKSNLVPNAIGDKAYLQTDRKSV